MFMGWHGIGRQGLMPYGNYLGRHGMARSERIERTIGHFTIMQVLETENGKQVLQGYVIYGPGSAGIEVYATADIATAKAETLEQERKRSKGVDR